MIDQEELRRREYVGRVNRVMDYVHANLAGDLRLETLARIASFSPFHFHRVFKAVIGETLNDFIRRVRATTAAARLLNNPRESITEISVQCGYSSPSAFAREFRAAFGTSASEFRRGGRDAARKIRQVESKNGQVESKEGRDSATVTAYTPDISDTRRTMMKFSVEVKQMPEWNVVYARHIGAYNKVGEAFERVFKWAGPRGLVRFPETKSLAVYHDSPEVTDPSKLRSDACLTVPPGTKVDGEIGTMKIPGGLFAVAHVEIEVTQFGEAWDRLIGEWMPKSGYQPDDRLCYEVYLNDPDAHPEKKWIVDICEPVRPL
ncbi:MAG: GyrI-like domain-containing protein [Candidatus Bipolaricaulota bacterium]|nr:GyrI-like domain-containing protein [Candidatus Bipolaricaulota bacterium]